MDFKTTKVTNKYCAIMTSTMVVKKDDLRALTIPCTIGMQKFGKALYDLGASINFIPLVVFQNLGLVAPKPIIIRLLMDDYSIKKPVGVLYDLLMKVIHFIFPIDLDREIDHEVAIILGRPFLGSGWDLVNVEYGKK